MADREFLKMVYEVLKSWMTAYPDEVTTEDELVIEEIDARLGDWS